jgi:hypothetical protein
MECEEFAPRASRASKNPYSSVTGALPDAETVSSTGTFPRVASDTGTPRAARTTVPAPSPSALGSATASSTSIAKTPGVVRSNLGRKFERFA